MIAAGKRPPTKEKVLVVDDTKSIRDFLVDYVLEPRGFEVIVATNGLEGLKLAAANEPDLMIVDNQMPQLTGLELLATLRDSGLEVPAILITAHGSEAIAVEAFRLGIRDYVIKPFEVDEMTAAIDRALRETRLERERDDLTAKLVDSNLQLQRRVQELNTLYGIGKSVSSSLELEKVLHRVVEGAVYVTGAEEGSLMLVDETRGELYVRASKNLDSDAQSFRLHVSDSYAGETLHAQRPLILTTTNAVHRRFLDKQGLQAVLYIPLFAHDKPLGVLSVANRYRDVVFTERETRVLSPLADYAAIAIRNAALYDQTESERHRLKTVLSQTDDPVLLIDEVGQLALINGAACTALGINPRQIGHPINTLIKNDDNLSFIQQPADLNFTPQGELAAEDGRIFNANMTIIPGVGRSLFLRDITQLKEVDRLKTELVSIVSHDLRSPLTSILGYIDLLERVGPINEQQANFIDRIQRSVANITTLISDLLDLGRLEAGVELALAPCQVGKLLLQIVNESESAIADKSLNISTKIAELPLVLADRNRLHQAFNNLISNAIKYTPQDGQISLEAYEKDGQIVVKINDNGIGISQTEQPYIFDKFYRADNVLADHEGTGLGLSIVRSIIEKHQGRVWAESELGRGATFSVVLPATRAFD